MPVIAILVLMWVMILSSCASHDALALEVQEYNHQYDVKMDMADVYREEVKEFVCLHLDCPENVQLDDVKMQGDRLASAHISFHYYF